MMAGFDDPFAPMPDAWWRLPATVCLVVRYRHARFGGWVSAAGVRRGVPPGPERVWRPYLDLAVLTRTDAYQPSSDPARWWGHRLLTCRHPATMFTTVIGHAGPRSVWLALPLQRLTGSIADTLREVHRRPASPT